MKSQRSNLSIFIYLNAINDEENKDNQYHQQYHHQYHHQFAMHLMYFSLVH